MLVTLQPGSTRQIIWGAAGSGLKPVSSWLVYNRDLVNPVVIGSDRDGYGIPDLATDVPAGGGYGQQGQASLVTALEQKTLAADRLNWWAAAPAANTGPVLLEITPSGTGAVVSPAEAAAQIAALGLALEDGNLATLLAQAQTGISPYVPGVVSASLADQGYGSFPITGELGLPVFIWGVWLSATVRATSAYATGTAGLTASVLADQTAGTPEIITLAAVQLMVNTAGDHDHADFFLPLNGVEIQATGTQPASTTLSVNGGTAVAGVVMRAAGGLLYSQ